MQHSIAVLRRSREAESHRLGLGEEMLRRNYFVDAETRWRIARMHRGLRMSTGAVAPFWSQSGPLVE
jgi:hypothetical protein